MLITSENDLADSLDRVTKVLGIVRNGEVYLQFFGRFNEQDAQRILFSQVVLTIAPAETGDLNDYEAFVTCVERFGDSMHCLVRPRKTTFALHRLPAVANKQGVVTNMAYVAVSFGTQRHPRENLYCVGIEIRSRSAET